MNSRGLSLIQVVLALGLFGVLISVMMSFNSYQMKLISQISRSSERENLSSEIIQVLTDNDLCSCQLNPDHSEHQYVGGVSDNLVFNSNITDGTQSIPLNTLNQKCDLTGKSIVAVNQEYRSAFTVSSLKLSNLTPLGTGNEWTSYFEVELNSNSDRLAIRPIRIPLRFRINAASPPGQRKIDACTGVNSSTTASSPIGTDCRQVIAANAIKAPCGIYSVASCAADEFAVSGGTYFVANIPLQNTHPVLTLNKPSGWQVTYFDTAGPGCTINEFPDGTSRPGTAPCFTTSYVTLCGAASAVCCK